MSLQEQIEKDIKALARKKSAAVLSGNLKYIKSEIQRIGKVVEDTEVVGIIKKFVKNEQSLPEPHQDTIDHLVSMLPVGMSEEDIIAWIHQNIDFGALPNKMAAMKPIMAALKDKGADGAIVKTLLERM